MSGKKHKHKKKSGGCEIEGGQTWTAIMESKETTKNTEKTASDAAGKATSNQKPSSWRSFKEWARQKSSFTDWCITAFTLILAVCAIYQFIIMGGQLDTMRKDQRPWIKVYFDPGTLAQDDLGAAHLVNLGKTPATNVEAEIVVQTVKAGEQPKFDYPHPHIYITPGVLFPNAPTNKMPIHRGHLGNNGSAEWSPLTESELEDARQRKIFVIAYGSVKYTDFFRISHWTKFCEYISIASGPYMYFSGISSEEPTKSCMEYADIDHN